MPTIMTHAVAGIALTRLLTPRPSLALMSACAFCAMLPDADVVSFAAGVPYGDMLGHRGLTHSLAFALAVGAAVGAWTKSARTALCIGLATVSHGLLDALTNGGLGVGFLIPFSADRYFFPWTPIQVSPIGLGFFSARGLSVFASELLWVWLPCAFISAANFHSNPAPETLESGWKRKTPTEPPP